MLGKGITVLHRQSHRTLIENSVFHDRHQDLNLVVSVNEVDDIKTDLSSRLFLLVTNVTARYWACNSVTRNVECYPEVRIFLFHCQTGTVGETD
jgi:hypothetical protein